MGYKEGSTYALNGYDSSSVSNIAANSSDFSNGTFVSMSSGFATVSNTSLPVAGVSLTEKVFASDNQTVAKAKVTYQPFSTNSLIKIRTSAAIAQADIGKFYNLTAAQLIDQATGATATIANGQFKLEGITDSTTVGIFSIIESRSI
jgi:hypothetical protein